MARALEIYSDLGQRDGEADALNSIGQLLLDTSDPHQALVRYRLALQIAREIGSSREEARAIEGSSRCMLLLGEPEEAMTNLRLALEIYQRIGAAEAGGLAVEIARLEAVAPPQCAEDGSRNDDG